jgi:hypothetical protein
MLDAAYIPSLWRVWEIGLRVLLVTVIGGLTPDHLNRANANVHRRLASSRRKRAPQVHYPLRR